MARTVTKTVFLFNELDAKAKEKAREWFREGNAQDTYWAESVIEDAVRMGALLGIEIDTHEVTLMGGGKRQDPTVYWSLGYSQSDFACFEGRYSYAPDAAAKITEESGGTETRLIALAVHLEAIQSNLKNTLTARVKYHHYYGLEVEFFSEPEDDSDALEISSEVEKETRDIFRDFNNWIYNGLRKENEYQNADEQVDENIRANEYEFESDGSRTRD